MTELQGTDAYAFTMKAINAENAYDDLIEKCRATGQRLPPPPIWRAKVTDTFQCQVGEGVNAPVYSASLTEVRSFVASTFITPQQHEDTTFFDFGGALIRFDEAAWEKIKDAHGKGVPFIGRKP